MTTPILDDYYSFPIAGSSPYKPYDDDRRTHGVCELKLCLGNSFNIPAVKTEYATGINYISNVELAMGAKSIDQPCTIGGHTYDNWPAPDQWAATLGSLTCGIKLIDLADGAATLADLGVQHDPMPVTSIVAEATGKTVWTYNATAAGRQVIPANVAYIMDQITSNDNNRIREFGRGGFLTLNPRRVSAKTGTAPFYIDNLAVGWTPTLVTAVMVGNPTQSCLKQSDQAFMRRQLARGNVVNGETSYLDPFSPSDLKHYGLKPVNGNCGHLDGVVSGYSGASPDLARLHAGRAEGRSRHVVFAAAQRHRGGLRQRRRLLHPGDPTGREHQLHVLRPRPAPDPDLHLCRSEGSSAAGTEPVPRTIAVARTDAEPGPDAPAALTADDHRTGPRLPGWAGLRSVD